MKAEGASSKHLKILELQSALIWMPIRISEKSEERAISREGSRPLAFCAAA
jgi:hypothetical protein